MESLTLNIVGCVLCEIITLLFVCLLHFVERHYIIELGYRTLDRQFKPQSNRLPLWDRLLYWSLCKNAKLKSRVLWIYFTSNVIVILCGFLSIPLCLYLVTNCELKWVIFGNLGFWEALFFGWGIPHFFLDLAYIPSVRKRYRMNSPKKRHK